MLRGKRFLAIVPARGGSTGIRDKNIRLFNGRPLIYWALDALTSLAVFDRVAVSTDSKKIAKCVKQYGSGVEVWRRPEELATSDAHVMDTMQYHIKELCERGDVYDYVIMHHATAPLVDRYDIYKAMLYLLNKKADFVISVCPSDQPLGFAKPIMEDGCVREWFPKEIRNLNRQEIKEPYQLDDNIYIGKWDIFKDNIDYWTTNIYAYKMPKSKCANIDDEDDFRWAEILFKQQLEKERQNTLWRFMKRAWNGRAN